MKMTKSVLNVSERILFVNTVMNQCYVDGRYEPALYDYAFNIALSIFCTDVDTENKTMDELSEIAFSDELYNIVASDDMIRLVKSLDRACKEKIQLENKMILEAFSAQIKNEPWNAIANSISDVANKFNTDEIIKKVLSENSKKNLSISNGQGTPLKVLNNTKNMVAKNGK